MLATRSPVSSRISIVKIFLAGGGVLSDVSQGFVWNLDDGRHLLFQQPGCVFHALPSRFVMCLVVSIKTRRIPGKGK